MATRRGKRDRPPVDPVPMQDAAAGPAAHPSSALPTLQRNALRKIFDRIEFSPAEVAELGVRRLKLADGLGEKGIRIIREWLAEHGHELAPEPTAARRAPRRSGGGWTLQSAMRLLRTHGYEISSPFEHGGPPAGRGNRSKSRGD